MKFYHPINGSTVNVGEGYSWHTVLFGVFYLIYKGLWKWAVISFLIPVAMLATNNGNPIPFFVLWLGASVWHIGLAFKINSIHASMLLARGYLTAEQYSQSKKTTKQRQPLSSVTDELLRLGELRSKQIISEKEFMRLKVDLIDKTTGGEESEGEESEGEESEGEESEGEESEGEESEGEEDGLV